jgi:hypothetical protein
LRQAYKLFSGFLSEELPGFPRLEPFCIAENPFKRLV